MLAPFLHFDADPYPVLLDGRIVYIVDGYTTTDRYPYSQRADAAWLPRDSGLRHRLNYVRNSVKAVVDAFSGGVTFYVSEPDDPLIIAYQGAFGGLFTPMAEMPASLVAHIRYSEDLFRIQSELWGAYHIDDTENFYQRASEWAVSQDPGRTGLGAASLTLRDSQGIPVGSRDARMPPYRTMVNLPNGNGAEFVIMRAFVPLDEDDARKELAAYMVGRSDGEHYGEPVVFRPPTSDFDGPALAEERIRNDEEVASLQTLLSQRGSSVLFGELLLVPIGNSILYVRPLYVQAEGDRTVPELERVIASIGERVVMASSIQEALEDLTGADLDDLFGGSAAPVATDVVDVQAPADPDGASTELTGVEVPERVVAVAAEIDRLQAALARALAETPPDWLEFGRLQTRIQELVAALVAEAG
jgi:uncharacterized membrane protein (UPF0182 family)